MTTTVPTNHIDPHSDDDPLAVALDPDNVLVRQVARWARTEPDRPFLVEAATGRTTTYGELWLEARRWARLLQESGVRAGGRVATMLPSSIDAHAVWLATGILHAYEVPVNSELRGEFLRHVLADAGVTSCIARPRHAALLEASGVGGIDVLDAPQDAPPTLGVEPLDVDALPGPEDISCVIYTSGTTGPAKGVVISWAQMAATIGRIPRRWLSGDDAVYSPWPMFHVTGRSPMCSMADVGGRVVLREKFTVATFWPDVREHRCTSTTVGAALSLLMAQPERDDDARNPLRIALLGRVGDEGWRFLHRFGAIGMCFYGSTEVGFPITARPTTMDTTDVVGWPRPGYSARLVDAAGDDVAPGEVGELWIRPPDRRLLFVEYLGDPERTTGAFAGDWYRTGDAMRQRPDGAFEFVDRMRDTIRRFGENISSTALETAVLTDDDVLECAAVGVPSPITGHDVLLVVTPRPGVDLDPGRLAERLADRLPRYMRPSCIAVVDALPKTPNGKIRKIGLATSVDLTSAWHAR